MDLIPKPNCKSNVWQYFGLMADKGGRPLDPGNPVCRLCRRIVHSKNGSTTNLRAHLRTRHSKVMAVTRPPRAIPTGKPWPEEEPSRAALSLPFCLNLRSEPEASDVSPARSSSKEWVMEMGVYTKLHLKEGLVFGPFVGELIREDSEFYYVDATDENKSNWMRYVSYATKEEDHNLIVHQINHQIYYKTSKPISQGGELKVRIGEDYAGILCLDTGDTRCDFGKKESILQLCLDVQLVTVEEPSSSLWFNNGLSQNAMPIIQKRSQSLANAIGNFLIRDLYQPAMVEGQGFRQLIQSLIPSYKELPSACTLEALLKDLHTKKKRCLRRLLRCKTEVSAERDGSNVGCVVVPGEYDWKVLQELYSVLKPMDVACQTLAKEAFPCLSLVKPILIGLLTRHLVSQPSDGLPLTNGLKMRMRERLAGCYENPAVNRILCLACSLDPQFRQLGFMEAEEQATTLDWLKEEAVKMLKENRRGSVASKQSPIKRSCSMSSSDSYDNQPRRSKRIKNTQSTSFSGCDDEDEESFPEDAAGEKEPAKADSPGGLSGMQFLLGDLLGSTAGGTVALAEEAVDIELSVFMADKRPSLGVQPLEWWKSKMDQYPLLAAVARAYLAAPAVAGSVAQDFLREGAINKKRSNIPPESLAEMLFLHHNHMTKATE
ncbi:hypothetical protein NHX12_017817 [Muraenolepis orangiensis]|uniref:BED-type domain-containing protein n=1 Tax=Muraenolepis orangiensis TaxID=630683 RepID=A0A9Q0EX82_9TELE|nr:hypothetical protein NHX12_017817 [Muraenolepis orangiensis]